MLVALALSGWAGALIAQVKAIRADSAEAKTNWTATRNRCLLLSSVSMNSLVLKAVYRCTKRLRR